MHDEQQLEGFQLSPPQVHLWSIQQGGDGTPFICRGMVDLEGPLDPEALETALATAVEELEILRTHFQSLPGMALPLQVIEEPEAPELLRHDLSSLESAEQEGRCAQLLADLTAEPWPEDEPASLRATLLTLGPEHHRLLLALPGLVSDEAGFRFLAERLAEWMEGGGAAAEEEDDEGLQYVDVSDWLNEMLEGEDGAVGREYWRGQLPADPQALRLPGEATALDLDPEWKARKLAFPDALETRLVTLAERLGIRLETLFLGAWQTLLWRMAEVGECPVGVAFNGRRYEELQGLVGLLTRYLPVNSGADPGMAFAHWVGDLEKRLDEAGRFQEAFRWRGASDGTPEPFCPYAFSYAEVPAAPSGGGLVFRTQEVVAVVENRRLEFAVRRGAERSLVLHYDGHRYSESWIERLGERLGVLLDHLLEAPETPLAQLQLLGSMERDRVLREFETPAEEQSDAPPIMQSFTKVAGRHGAELAVVQGEARWTYEELQGRSEGLAQALRGADIGPERVVALFLERSPEMVMGQLASLSAGGAFLPLDPAYPRERVAFMLEDSAAAVVVTTRELAENLPPHTGVTLFLEDVPETAELEPSQASEHNLAYLIYTSGSTGRPKGVAVTRGNLARSTAARFAYYSEAPTGYLLLPSFAFDSSIAGIYWPLLAGGTLILPEEEPQNDPNHLVELFRRGSVSHVLTLPSLYDLLLEQSEVLETLSVAIVAGEACPQDLVERHYRRTQGTALYDEYGPTEGTVWSTVEACVVGEERVSIGRPVPGCRVYLRGVAFEPLPVGLSGELLVGGGGVARGYLGRPGLTADRFVPDPWAEVEGARLYRTGDRARYREDGRIDFLGRMDSQVKIRGYRIELGEIEALLTAEASVRAAVVAARGDGADRRLVAYWVTAASPAPAPEILRSALLGKLPEYMVPTAWVLLDELPRTPGGKVDRNALPEDDDGGRVQGPYVAPRNPVEEMLAGMWADVLKLERIGATDNFFALGGHSLSATRVITRINEAFGVELTLPRLFAAPTPAQMADVLGETEVGEAQAPILAVPRDGRHLPLSFAQQRLWFLDQLEPGGTEYIVPSVLRFRGALNREALEASLAEIVARHEVLRTTFEGHDGEPQQVIHKGWGHLLEYEDLRELGEEGEARAMGRIREAIATPFDLAQGPLLRVRLYQLESSYLMLLASHHIVTDLWSMGVFVRELETLYHAANSVGLGPENPSPLEPLSIQYADFAVWQREWLVGEVLERQLEYWRRQLAGPEEGLALPADRPRPTVQTFHGSRVSFRLPAEVRGGVTALARRGAATPFMVLLALFQTLLHRYSGQRGISVGSPVAGRTRRETEAPHRLFRQHVGAAHRSLRASRCPPAARSGAHPRPRGLLSPRSSLRAVGGGPSSPIEIWRGRLFSR